MKRNMASIGILLFLFAVCRVAAGNPENNFVSIDCEPENVGRLGGPSMLECKLQLSAAVSDFNIRVMSWTKIGSDTPVLVYNRGKWTSTPGYEMAVSSWSEKNANVSLLITNTKVADDGEYECLVVTDRGDAKRSTSLKVKEKYSQPTVRSIPKKIDENEDSALICEAYGGYPQGEIRWFDVHKKDWTASSKTESKPTENGLFQLSSKLSLLQGSTFSEYTCAVYDASGSQEAEVTFHREPFEPALPSFNSTAYSFTSTQQEKGPEQQTKPAHFVAPVVVIGSLIVGLLLLMVMRRRRQSQHNHSEVAAEDHDVEGGDLQKTEK
ncbi:unnamed protein product [Ophioblennius macclurei]